MGDVSDHKSPVDQALDLLVYAPLGFALDARTLLPKLVARGRTQVTWPAGWASTPSPRARRPPPSAYDGPGTGDAALTDLGLLPNGAPPRRHRPPRSPDRPRSVPARPPGPPRPRPQPAPTWPSPTTTASRRRRWSPGSRARSRELEAVRAYEAGRRGRKTILNKIAQLQG